MRDRDPGEHASASRRAASGAAAGRDARSSGGAGAAQLRVWLRRLRRALLGGDPGYPPSPRLDRVAPWLVIGPVLHPDQYHRLRRFGVTHVVDLRAEASDDEAGLRALGIELHRVPVEDRHAPTDEQFGELAGWLDARHGAVVYLHCQGGLGRTPTSAAALLMARGFTRSEALRLVRAARPESSPTEAQRDWLERLRFGPSD